MTFINEMVDIYLMRGASTRNLVNIWSSLPPRLRELWLDAVFASFGGAAAHPSVEARNLLEADRGVKAKRRKFRSILRRGLRKVMAMFIRVFLSDN